jgi:hypothetical protein
MMYDVFLICPVRNASEKQKKEMTEYIIKLKLEGKKVYYPGTDTNQVDLIGYRICNDNRKAIEESKEVHIYFDVNSAGSLFDLGMAFALKKKLYIVNKGEYVITNTRSFANITMEWDRISWEIPIE